MTVAVTRLVSEPEAGSEAAATASSSDRVSTDASEANQLLALKSAQQRVQWALEHLPGEFALSSSFGAQAAVLLHMVTAIKPNIPVIVVDTGYLFPETYRFIDELTERLNLNLKVYRAQLSIAWQEARYGKLWEQGLAGIEQYNQLRKVEPMQRALRELNIGSWFSGVRRSQSASRAKAPLLQRQQERYKLHPIADWTDRDVGQYLKKHGLPYHPLWEKGYVSIGDWHTTRPLGEGMSEEDTRFFGLKRECGIHDFSI
ncbi:phosphoadenylyl-sulfate reductase [Permianibacter sp. IMCC34836]|uniref:phosphoadenylyl-sulfate reductase n=1 Tax=Permianibacter fluminis TaxID=2738515 RepID=UPI0015541DEB|nr:phosphoadenylyl-sulfate reductase [Permianibacter fluminis]NQD36381.1 phosphoadenylyl-sulfate reductase [Permianibacter fluminis]